MLCSFWLASLTSFFFSALLKGAGLEHTACRIHMPIKLRKLIGLTDEVVLNLACLRRFPDAQGPACQQRQWAMKELLRQESLPLASQLVCPRWSLWLLLCLSAATGQQLLHSLRSDPGGASDNPCQASIVLLESAGREADGRTCMGCSCSGL